MSTAETTGLKPAFDNTETRPAAFDNVTASPRAATQLQDCVGEAAIIGVANGA